jgi:AsmA-like C-terminal region
MATPSFLRLRIWAVPVILVAALGLASVAWQVWGPSALMPVVLARVDATTGFRLAADGPASATLIPVPHLHASGIRLSGEDGNSTSLRADAIDVDMPWAALLRGQLTIRRVRLSRLRLVGMPLHPPADADIELDASSQVDAVLTAGGLSARIHGREEAGTLALDRIELRGGGVAATGAGRLLLRDPLRLVANLNLTTPGGPGGPLALALSYSADGFLLERMNWRRPDGVETELFGHAAADHGVLRFEGGVGASVSAPSTDSSARFDGTVGADGLTVAISDLDVRAAGSHLTGRASFRSGSPAVASAELRLDRLDLDAVPSRLADALLPVLTPIVADADATLRVRLGEIGRGGRMMADGIVVDVAHRAGKLELRELAARSAAGAPFRASGEVTLGTGPVVTLGPFSATYDRIDASGRVQLDLAGERPKVVGDLTMGAIDFDTLFAGPPPLPPEPMTRRAAAAAAASARRPAPPPGWVHTPIPLPASSAVDADIVATSPRVAWRGRKLTEARAQLQTRAGAFAIQELTGTIYGGRLDAHARIDAGPAPHVTAQAALDGADLAAVLADTVGVRSLSGRGNVTAELSADGDSEADLIASLAGNVRLNARDGAVSGLDLSGISDRLKRLQRPADVVQLARLAAGGGRTPFQSLSGHIRIDRGIARTDDLQLTAAGGAARVRGTVNLPAWTLDLTNELQLTDLPGLPPLVLKLDGPIAAPREVFDISRLQSQLLNRPSHR